MATAASSPLTTGPLKHDTESSGEQDGEAAENADGVYTVNDGWQQDILLKQPAIQDELRTVSSLLQDDTREDCLPFLNGTSDASEAPTDFNHHGVPSLQRELHIEYLHDTLQQLPPHYVGFDASRPWIIYWALLGLSLLGEDVSPYRERVIQTFLPMQNYDGGFGGGHGQLSHCAPSYSAILSLAMVGGREALDLIDRRALWKWLATLKQEDGGFALSQDGEEDVRGAYCAIVMVTLLRLPLELPRDASVRRAGIKSLVDGLPQWLSRCQTYEGGIAGAPGTEAHGAYAFCDLACLCMLGQPSEYLSKYLDLPLLASWISARQYAPEGGYSGRTGKLVDSCYSHWVGGCMPLIQQALTSSGDSKGEGQGDGSLRLYSQGGLLRYIMCCSQSVSGGFRDKPHKPVDGQHTCYALAGLSAIQHDQCYDTGAARVGEHVGEGFLDVAFGWTPLNATSDKSSRAESIWNSADTLAPIHPIFSIPYSAVEEAHSHFLEKGGF